MSHILIVGRSGCGKTHFLLKYLQEHCRQKYNTIYIICPTFSINTTWQNWSCKSDSGVMVFETSDITRAIKNILSVHVHGKKGLIIFDDIAFTKDVKQQSSELVKLGFSGRHRGLDTIVLTQQLTSIAKAYREGITFLVSFYMPGKRNMKVIVDEFLDSDVDFKSISTQLRKTPYARLEISLESPYGHQIKC